MAVIAACAVMAPILCEYLPGPKIPRVVYEIVLGIVVGPQVLHWAGQSDVVDGFAEFGLAFLIFLAGFEIEIDRVKGRPINLAVGGWVLSLAVGGAAGFVLMHSGFVLSELIVGMAITTTALGTLLPIVADSNLLRTRAGAHLMAIGTVGEFLPIVAVALLLSSANPVRTAGLLVVFVLLSLASANLALRTHPPRLVALLVKHLNSTAQLPVRVIVLLLVLLLVVAHSLGLDVLLGAFVAGVLLRLMTAGEQVSTVVSKLDGIAYGFFIPFFFIVSGTRFDLRSLTEDPTDLIRVVVFLVLMLVARGVPTYLVLRREAGQRVRLALSFMAATQLPLVVVVTQLGVQTGRMRPANAAALVAAGLLSVMIFPLVAMRLLGSELGDDADGVVDAERPVDPSVAVRPPGAVRPADAVGPAVDGAG